MDQADKEEDLGWGYFCEWAFFAQKTSLPRRGKENCILNSSFPFFSGAYYISMFQNNRMTASHFKIFFSP